MRILMLSPYLPWPLHGGSSVRMFNIIKGLSQKGHRIVLVAGRGKGSSLEERMGHLCERIYSFSLPSGGRLSSVFRSLFSSKPYPASKFQTKELRDTIISLLRKEHFDLIWINFLILADTLSLNFVKNIPMILDQHEADELIWRRYIQNGNFAQKTFSLWNLKKVQQLQRKVFPQVDVILCVSEAEAEFTRSRIFEHTQVWTVPNGVDMDFFCPTSSNKREPVILLVGAMNVFRNIDAAVWFARKIFPQVKQTTPDAQFWIVGNSPDKEILKLQRIEGIKVMGTVEDIRPYYERAMVFVAPYRFGEGTRLKLLEAMAMRVPIVSTPVGCQGIEVMDGQHLLIADNTEAGFCERVIGLLHNPERGHALVIAGRRLVEQKYDWKRIIADLESRLWELVQK